MEETKIGRIVVREIIIKVETIKIVIESEIVRIIKIVIESEIVRITIKTEINNIKIKTVTIIEQTEIEITITVIEVKSIKGTIE